VFSFDDVAEQITACARFAQGEEENLVFDQVYHAEDIAVGGHCIINAGEAGSHALAGLRVPSACAALAHLVLDPVHIRRWTGIGACGQPALLTGRRRWIFDASHGVVVGACGWKNEACPRGWRCRCCVEHREIDGGDKTSLVLSPTWQHRRERAIVRPPKEDDDVKLGGGEAAIIPCTT
jgi:hypothetical protein